MSENKVLVIVDDKAKWVFINGHKIAMVRAVELLGMVPMEPASLRIDMVFDSYEVATREYGIPVDEQAMEYFAPPLASCAAKFTGTQNFSGGAFDSRQEQNEHMAFGRIRQSATLREFQTNLPWSIKYSEDFRRNPQPHKDFAHALTHVHKAAGKLSAFVDDMDHRKEEALNTKGNRDEYTKYLADLVICALRMANTFPGGVIDLQNAVKDRLEAKNGVTL